MKIGYVYGDGDLSEYCKIIATDNFGIRKERDNLINNCLKRGDVLVVRSLDHLADTISGITAIISGLSKANRWIESIDDGLNTKKIDSFAMLKAIANAEKKLKEKRIESAEKYVLSEMIKRRKRKIPNDKTLIRQKILNNQSDRELARLYNCSDRTVRNSKRRYKKEIIRQHAGK